MYLIITHMRIVLHHSLREVGEKVVVQDDGDAVQQGGVDGGAAKNAVDVASATV